jgi:5'-phosphate synthase pdxT subunit
MNVTDRIGVLALQGGFAAHSRALEDVAGLILPGGESTTQLKLLARHGLEPALESFVRSGRPVLATCAGLILAAREVQSPAQRSFGWLDVAVARNAWGRQVDSFVADADAPSGLPLVFIRAPRILSVGPKVEVLAAFKTEPVLVRQGSIWGATFHPELTLDRRVHQWIFGDS